MSYVVRFQRYRPGSRDDGIPWTFVEIYESATEDGTYLLIDTLPLSPVDADPLKPVSRNFTTSSAEFPDGWYYVAFVDGDGNRQTTDPVHRGATPPGIYYTTTDAVRLHLGVTEAQMPDDMLARTIRLAQDDIDAACGGWVVYEDTGLKFSSIDLALSDVQGMLLSQATCEQVEYRMTVGDDFLIREQYETQSGPGYGTSGQLRKVTGRAYSKLSQGGFLRLTSHTSNTNGRAVGDLPRAN